MPITVVSALQIRVQRSEPLLMYVRWCYVHQWWGFEWRTYLVTLKWGTQMVITSPSHVWVSTNARIVSLYLRTFASRLPVSFCSRLELQSSHLCHCARPWPTCAQVSPPRHVQGPIRRLQISWASRSAVLPFSLSISQTFLPRLKTNTHILLSTITVQTR